MSLEEEIRKKFGKMQKVAIERLHPPMAPIVSEKSVEDISEIEKDSPQQSDSKLAIDWKAMSDASEFRRFVYWIRTGQVFRGSNNKLDEDLWKTQDDINMVRELKRIDPNASNFGDVMKEYKDKVRRLREK